MARTPVATDTFTDLTAWTQPAGAFYGSMTINSGRVTSNNGDIRGNNTPSIYRTSGTYSDDQYSSFEMVNITQVGAEYGLAATVRNSGTDASRNYFGASLDSIDAGGGTRTARLFKMVSGTWTSLHSGAVTWAAGDDLSIEVAGQSPNITLRLMRDTGSGPTLVSGFELTGQSGPNSGKPGIAGNGGSTLMADNWEGGDITSSSAITGRSLLLGIG
jgi:hypothetical protein